MVWTLGFGFYSSLFFFFLSVLLENWVFLIKSSFQTAHWLPVSPVFPSLLEIRAGEILDQKWMWKGQHGLKGSFSGFTHIRAGLSAEHFPECRRATTCANVVFYIYRKSLGCTVLKGFDHMMKNCSRLKRWPTASGRVFGSVGIPFIGLNVSQSNLLFLRIGFCIYFWKWCN